MATHKMHHVFKLLFLESLPSETCPEMNVSRNFFVAAISLREVEIGSISCNKDVARHVPFRACYTRQQFVQLVSQRRKKKKLRNKLQEKLPSVTEPSSVTPGKVQTRKITLATSFELFKQDKFLR